MPKTPFTLFAKNAWERLNNLLRKFVQYEKLYYFYTWNKMKTETILISVSTEEADLIAAIRNYVKTYPDGYPELLDYAQRLFDDLTYPYND